MKTLAYVKKPDVAVGVWKVDSEPVPQWVIDRMVATMSTALPGTVKSK